METMEQEDDRLWADLETEFENQASNTLKLDLGKPPTRRRTFSVAHQQSLFSGFYPMLAICSFAAVAGQWTGNEQIGLTALLLVFPIAALLAPLLRDPKRGLWFYGLLGLLAGGATHLGAFVVEFCAYRMAWNGWSGWSWLTVVAMLQGQLERFFRPENWVLYGLCGLLIGILTSVWKRRVPWMDSPPTRRVQMALAAFAILLPLLIPLTFALVGESLYKEPIQWLVATRSAHPEIQIQRSWFMDEKEWQSYLKQNAAETGPVHRSTDRKAKADIIPVEELQRIENEFLTMVPSDGRQQWTTYTCRVLEDLLLSRRSDLRTPLVTTWNITERAMWERSQGGGERETDRLLDMMLSELSVADLSEADGKMLHGRVLAFRNQLQPDLEEMDLRMLYLLDRRYGQGEAPTALKILGMEWVGSPTQVCFQYESSHHLKTWLEFRAELQALEPSQHLALLRERALSGEQTRPSRYSLLGYLYEHTYGSELRPQLEAAEVLIVARLYRQETGRWPDGVGELADRLSFPADPSRWEFSQVEGHGLSIKDEVLMDRASQATEEDVFPPRVQTPGEWTLP
jgi:hypothetical protein